MGKKKEPMKLPCDKCGKDARDNEYFFRVCSCCVDEVRRFMKKLNKDSPKA